LLARHVELFNRGVRTGDFAAMCEQLAEDAHLVFEGVPVGPFAGRDAIAAAYREQPPDDTIEVLGAVETADGTIVADYAWSAPAPLRAGELHLTPAADGRIAHMRVTFA
jgi:steroid Delta-isomerase